MAMLLMAALLVVPTGFSSVLVEPFVGYAIGEGDIEGSSSDYDGVLFGGKLGYRYTLFNAGLRYDRGAMDVEYGGSTVESTHSAYGVFVGLDLPILLRASLTYYIASDQKIKPSTGSAINLEGNGQSIHVGMGFAALVNLFFEYHQHNYDNDDKANWYMFGVSLPLDF